MSYNTVIYWPSANSNELAIAPLQVVGDNHIVKINSNLPNQLNVPVNNSGIYLYNSMIRRISITSLDTETVTYTITGLGAVPDGNKNPTSCLAIISENIVGSNSTPKNSANLYKRIDSITTSAPTGGQIAVGFGDQGITAYNFPNLNSSSLQQWVGQIQPLTADGSFVWKAYMSMTFPEVINTQYGNVTPFPAPIPAFQIANGTNVPAFFSSINPDIGMARMVWVNIDDSAGDGNAAVYYTFIQQGVA